LAGFFLCSAVSSLAVVSALRHRVKVWVGPEARWAREQDLWPPHSVARRGATSNRTKAILLSVLITVVVFGFLLVFLPLSFYFCPPQAQQKGSEALVIISLLAFMFGVPRA